MPVDCAAGVLYVAEPEPLMQGGGGYEQVDLATLTAQRVPHRHGRGGGRLRGRRPRPLLAHHPHRVRSRPLVAPRPSSAARRPRPTTPSPTSTSTTWRSIATRTCSSSRTPAAPGRPIGRARRVSTSSTPTPARARRRPPSTSASRPSRWSCRAEPRDRTDSRANPCGFVVTARAARSGSRRSGRPRCRLAWRRSRSAPPPLPRPVCARPDR